MANPLWEHHPNPNEFFPLRGTLGAPGEGASGAKLAGDILAALAALALAAAALFYFYIDCTPLYIGFTSVRIEVTLYNREEEQQIYWMLVEGDEPEELPPDVKEKVELLLKDISVLDLINLRPGTEYTLVFVEFGPDGTPNMVHTYTFRTPGPGSPSASDEDPPAADDVPKGPEGNTPPVPPVTETDEKPPETSQPVTEETEPVPGETPPPGGAGDDDTPPDPTESETEQEGPAVQPPQLQNFAAPDPYGENGPGSYVAVFTFEKRDAVPQGIQLTGTLEHMHYWSEESGTIAVEETFGYDAASGSWASGVTESDGIITLRYPVSSALLAADLSATLTYTLGEEETVQRLDSAIFRYGPGYLMEPETSDTSANTITAGEEADGWVPVTVRMLYIAGVSSDFYDFRVEPGFAIIDPQGDYIELTEGADYRLTGTTQEADSILIQADIKVDLSWDYFILFADAWGEHYLKDGTNMQLGSGSSARAQINLTSESYSVGPLTVPQGSLHGIYCGRIEIYTDAMEGDSLSGLVPGQIVQVSVDLDGTSTKDFDITLGIEKNEVGLEPWEPGFDTEKMTVGKDYGVLMYKFVMPARNVTAEDIVFSALQEVDPESGIAMETGTAVSAGAAVPGIQEGDSLGSHSVGPISITQEVNGLRCTQAWFHTDSQFSQPSLDNVQAGETVYLEILLEGSAQRNFQLSASFAPSAKITDLKILNQDSVSIVDTDAYLYLSFTMPDSSVTAADLGFQRFLAG